jgi:hypothetical protein
MYFDIVKTSVIAIFRILNLQVNNLSQLEDSTPMDKPEVTHPDLIFGNARELLSLALPNIILPLQGKSVLVVRILISSF